MERFNVPYPSRNSRKRWHQMGPSVVAIFFGVLGGAGVASSQAGTIEGINHTHWAINHFSVDGLSGLDLIGPYQGGGGGCCYIAPTHWRAGMTVQVDWETGVAYAGKSPGYADWPRYLAWERDIVAQSRKHTRVVKIPDYTDEKVCGITVHFLPCEDIKVTTSCYAYGHPEYPIKTPLNLPIPDSCPATG